MREPHLFILDENGDPKPVASEDLLTWGRWFENSSSTRRIACTEIGSVAVSTVFLGIDHNWDDEGPPILFETMVFGGDHDQKMERYATREEALNGHERWVQRVMR